MEGLPEREAPAAALAAVLKHSSALPSESAQVRGYDFNHLSLQIKSPTLPFTFHPKDSHISLFKS